MSREWEESGIHADVGEKEEAISRSLATNNPAGMLFGRSSSSGAESVAVCDCRLLSSSHLVSSHLTRLVLSPRTQTAVVDDEKSCRDTNMKIIIIMFDRSIGDEMKREKERHICTVQHT